MKRDALKEETVSTETVYVIVTLRAQGSDKRLIWRNRHNSHEIFATTDFANNNRVAFCHGSESTDANPACHLMTE